MMKNGIRLLSALVILALLIGSLDLAGLPACQAAAAESELTVSARRTGSFKKGQDGAVFGDYIFRFIASGGCFVYRVADFTGEEMGKSRPYAAFKLDRSDEIVPHANAVCFGSEYYEEGDEFPLLYANIYNNYEKEKDRLWGVCCVYRLTRGGKTFSTTLVQIIRIGFLDEGDLWISRNSEGSSVHYGNFAVDPVNNLLVAFVMRMGDQTTRYFTFRLPKSSEGEPHPTLGVNCVTLSSEDILSYFDGNYSHFIQGACVRDGKLYSLEGRGTAYREAGLRVSDLLAGKELYYLDLTSNGMTAEPELIDFTESGALFSDYNGTVYLLDIDALEAGLGLGQ